MMILSLAHMTIAQEQVLPEVKSYSYSSYQANDQAPEVYYQEQYQPQQLLVKALPYELETMEYDMGEYDDEEYTIPKNRMAVRPEPVYASAYAFEPMDYDDDELDYAALDVEYYPEDDFEEFDDQTYRLDDKLAMEDLFMYPEENASAIYELEAEDEWGINNVFEELMSTELRSSDLKKAIMLGTDWNEANFMKFEEIIAGELNEIEVLVSGLAGTSGYVNAWINLNKDGEFQEDEMIASDLMAVPSQSLNMAQFDSLGGVFGSKLKFNFQLPKGLPTGFYNLMIEINDLPQGLGEIVDSVSIDIPIMTAEDFAAVVDSDAELKRDFASRPAPGLMGSFFSFFKSSPENLKAPVLLTSSWATDLKLPTDLPLAGRPKGLYDSIFGSAIDTPTVQPAVPYVDIEPLASKTSHDVQSEVLP